MSNDLEIALRAEIDASVDDALTEIDFDDIILEAVRSASPELAEEIIEQHLDIDSIADKIIERIGERGKEFSVELEQDEIEASIKNMTPKQARKIILKGGWTNFMSLDEFIERLSPEQAWQIIERAGTFQDVIYRSSSVEPATCEDPPLVDEWRSPLAREIIAGVRELLVELAEEKQ